jgi:hypothetical protein
MGRQPALVITRNEAIDGLNEVFVVLATTRIRGLPTEMELGHEDGMPATASERGLRRHGCEGISGRAHHDALAPRGSLPSASR